MNSGEQKALSDIDEFGCHVLHVMEGDGCPRFSYSIGIQKSTDQPELIVTGLKQELAHWIVNEYNARVSAGEKFVAGKLYEGFLGEFKITFKEVEKDHYDEYFGWGIWLYKGHSFRVLQLVYPSTTGVWPWDESASEDFTWFIPKLYAN